MYQQAEPLLRRALVIREQCFGTDHSITVTTLSNLAFCHQSQGEEVQAEVSLKRALAIREHQMGADHPDTATSLHNLAGFYHRQGKSAKAEPLFWRALVIREQRLGMDHPDTLFGLIDLADFYHQQGRDDEAELLYQQALSRSRQQEKATSPMLAIILTNLMHFYAHQSKYTQAEALLFRVLSDHEQLGRTRPVPTRRGRNRARISALSRLLASLSVRARPLLRRRSRPSLAALAQVREGAPAITSVPTSPIAGMPATITYQGWLAPHASRLIMHWGHNHWNGITDTPMTRQNEDSWKAILTIPWEATSLNMAFRNQDEVWDNHQGHDYRVNVLTIWQQPQGHH